MKTKTKTLLATLAGAAAVAAIAAPAAAQGYDRYGDRYDHSRYEQGRYDQGRYEQRWMSQRATVAERRIDQGLQNGELTRREHARLSQEVRAFARLEAAYRSNGLNWRERAELDDRYDALTRDIRRAAYDEHRQYGYGYRR